MYNLTSSQQNIWNLQKYYEGTTISAICGANYIKDEIDTEILKKAINHVIEHQSGLQLRFYEVNGKPIQQVDEYQYEEIPVLQFSDKESLRQYVLQCAQKLTGLLQTDSGGYGLKNVHERLQLTYGEEYGLTINSIPGESTMITFTIPL